MSDAVLFILWIKKLIGTDVMDTINPRIALSLLGCISRFEVHSGKYGGAGTVRRESMVGR